MLDHGFAGNIGQDFSGKPGGAVLCGYNSENFHNIFSPQRPQRTQSKNRNSYQFSSLKIISPFERDQSVTPMESEAQSFHPLNLQNIQILPGISIGKAIAEIPPNPPLQRGAGGISGRSFQMAERLFFSKGY
jgi:hypothetical protein